MEQIYVKCVRSGASGGAGGGVSGGGGGSVMDYRNFLESLLRLARARYPMEHLMECMDVFLAIRQVCPFAHTTRFDST